MRTKILILFVSLLTLAAPALTPVQYNATDFTGTVNNLPVTLTSIMKVQTGTSGFLLGLPIVLAPSAGTAATNLNAGLYNMTIQGIPRGVLLLVPDTNVTQNLINCVVSNMTSFTAANLGVVITNQLRLASGTNIVVTTNGFVYTVNAAVTNGAGLTNINASALVYPNLIPSGAFFTDEGGFGEYDLPVTVGQTYYAIITDPDVSLFYDPDQLKEVTLPGGLFTSEVNLLQIFNSGGGPFTGPVAPAIQIFLATNNVIGNLYGAYNGSPVPIRSGGTGTDDARSASDAIGGIYHMAGANAYSAMTNATGPFNGVLGLSSFSGQDDQFLWAAGSVGSGGTNEWGVKLNFAGGIGEIGDQTHTPVKGMSFLLVTNNVGKVFRMVQNNMNFYLNGNTNFWNKDNAFATNSDGSGISQSDGSYYFWQMNPHVSGNTICLPMLGTNGQGGTLIGVAPDGTECRLIENFGIQLITINMSNPYGEKNLIDSYGILGNGHHPFYICWNKTAGAGATGTGQYGLMYVTKDQDGIGFLLQQDGVWSYTNALAKNGAYFDLITGNVYFTNGNFSVSGNITNSALTASRAVVTSGNKALSSSAATATEVGYLSGVTSALQTQLNLLAPLASPTFTGTISGNGSGITALNASSLASGTLPNAVFPATLPAASGTNLTSLNAANVGGTFTTATITTANITTANITTANANVLTATNRITGPLLEALDGSGANASGTKTTVAGGNSTGTGAGGAAVIRTAFSGSSGSSANTLVDRAHFSAHQVTLTHATATTIANVTVASGKSFEAVVRTGTTANGSGDIQGLSSHYGISAVNKAGTVTTSASAFAGGATAALSSGTLTVTITAVANGNSVDIKATATSSLTTPTYACGWYIDILYTDDTGLTITDQ